jgi:hypothetical protein
MKLYQAVDVQTLCKRATVVGYTYFAYLVFMEFKFEYIQRL